MIQWRGRCGVIVAALAATALGLAASAACAQEKPKPAEAPLDWKTQETLLSNHVQLTSRAQFVKAGEAYFDHHTPPEWVVFQAIPVPAKGEQAAAFYSMYVAKLKLKDRQITGIEEPILLSPPGSANTCGWFHPTIPGRVIFGSTLVPPSEKQRPGFQVGTGRYVWQFPAETEVVSVDVPAIVGKAGQPSKPAPVFTRANYDAECSVSKDGRTVLYAHVRDEPTNGREDADIWVFDTKTGTQHELVKADGYDGGPFYSPDGARICYRSDRRGDNLLQLFVAELSTDKDGVPTGITKEHALTRDNNVNWAPYWHPSGKFLVYATSAVSHGNYEVFAIAVPPAGAEDKAYEGLKPRRVTVATGADVLPVFSDDGAWMMWTSQRGAKVEGEERPSSQVWVARVRGEATEWAVEK